MVTDKTIATHVFCGSGNIKVAKSNHQWTPVMNEHTRNGLFVRSEHTDCYFYFVTEKGETFFEFVEL